MTDSQDNSEATLVDYGWLRFDAVGGFQAVPASGDGIDWVTPDLGVLA